MMRIWGRIQVGIDEQNLPIYETYPNSPSYVWRRRKTDANGENGGVYVTNLVQVLKLNRNESPFYANYGIPGEQSVMSQIFPDFYVAQTQAQFSAFFASLLVARLPTPPPPALDTPVYVINATLKSGSILKTVVPI